MAASVEFSQVTKSFGRRVVFRGFNLSVPRGEFVSIVGRSGCGKSTLLRLVAGLERATEGSVKVSPAPKLGYVFQESQLLPWRTVAGNVALPLELKKSPLQDRAGQVERALRLVGMTEASALYPSQLSGGMKMRTSLARALILEPDVLLLDEPFAALDELSRVHLEEELRGLWIKTGMTVLFVTHSFSEAVFLSDRIVILSEQAQGLGDILEIPLGKVRTEALRSQPAFSALIQECRRKFERLQVEVG